MNTSSNSSNPAEEIALKNAELLKLKRELEIEASLERVRSRAMATQKSDELAEVVAVIYQEIEKLGLADWGCNIQIFHESDSKIEIWLSSSIENMLPKSFYFPVANGHPEIKRQWGNYADKMEHSVIALKGEFKKSYDEYVLNYTDFRNLSKEMKASIRSLDEVYFSCALMKYGFITAVKNDRELNSEEFVLLSRFAKTFEQTYTRFLDFQKAEAQAREAEIELALEKVRSRSMAMHSSDELLEASDVMLAELEKLRINALRIGICTMDAATGASEIWTRFESQDKKGNKVLGVVPKGVHHVFDDMHKSWLAKEPYFTNTRTGKKVVDYYKKLVPFLPYPLPKTFNDSETISCFFFLEGSINAVSLAPLNDDECKIVLRFAKVFEQTYTRFLDLQKAEAQTREAQIEAALERVRSRTLGMQRSEELQDAANLLFQQIEILGVNAFGTGFNIWDEDRKASTAWMAGKDRQQAPFKTSSLEDIYVRIHDGTQAGKSLFVEEQIGDELKAHYEYLLTIPVFKEVASKLSEQGIALPRYQIMHCAYFSKGYLMFITHEPVPEAHDIFKRFAKVFEQTYTRFLDLQKAEAQAREAEIELALERVRARTMAMHRSEELGEVAILLYKEFNSLKMGEFFNCGFVIINEASGVQNGWMTQPEGNFIEELNLPLSGDTIMKKRLKEWREKTRVFYQKVSGEKLAKHIKYVSDKSFSKNQVNNIIPFMPDPCHFYCGNFKEGYLHIVAKEELVTEAETILSRFTKVFSQTYTRFQDIQKSEAQAREANIEVALERVRARTMAMQHSRELQEAAIVLFEQVRALGFDTGSCGFNIWEKDQKEATVWVSSPEGGLQMPFTLPHTKSKIYKSALKAMKVGSDFYIQEVEGEELTRHFDYLLTIPGIGEVIKNLKENHYDFPEKMIFHFAFFKQGYLSFHGHKEAPEAKEIFKRFAKVFEQTYTRFLDLQKAEEQAREAQIEAALERVRSHTMAMQKSDELSEVAALLFKQLKMLGADLWTAVIAFCKEDEVLVEKWGGSPITDQIFDPVFIPYNADHGEQSMYDTWKNKVDLYSYIQDGKELKDIYDHLMTIPSFKASFQKVIDAGRPLPIWQKNHVASYMYGYLLIVTEKEFEEEYVFTRFAKVFEQTYTRFLDLQKAEAQAREARIETALERVRARTMGMQKSEELSEISFLLDGEVRALDIKTWGCAFNIYRENDSLEWFGNAAGVLPTYIVPREGIFKKYYDYGQNEESFYVQEIAGQECIAHYEFMSNLPVIGKTLKLLKESNGAFPNYQIDHVAYFKYGYLLFITIEPVLDAHDIFKRFAKVFEQTYTRFLDLQKAEAQAREAQIEASLERIRTQAMAMRHSDDLIKSTTILFEELEKLELPIERSGIGIFDLETKDCELWTMVVAKDGQKELATGITSMTVHPMLTETFDAWVAQRPVSYTLEGQDLVDYYQLISKGDFHLSEEAIGSSSDLPKEYYEYMPFGGGGVYFFSDTKPEDADKQIMRRFAEVFHLTYTRYEDLQKAEARAQEAIKQASLERVRGEIASMRSKDDLNRITPLMWNELKSLEVPFIRCGVFIVNEEMQHVEVYLSSSEGLALGALDLAFDANEMTERTVEAWRKQKVYHQHWNQEEFVNWTNLMIKAGQVKNQKTYQGMDEAPKSLDLHFIPFTQGLLYVGSTDALINDDIGVVQALADSFAIAYARYDDFVKLEKAKESIELTLSELKDTQKQLIQSEKMASLGELTAGIAHEIQNPLNFVNNFSEVSVEMIKEVRDERLKTKDQRDEALEDEILSDIEQNLQKINHHGNRASSIVKGMLEHSRTSSGVKELTDINALADEYLRLSYHGLRAKDKSFNAEIVTNFDSKLPKIEVVSQDIGRVLLNLINNAFQAVHEASTSSTAKDYKPTVSITTELTALPIAIGGQLLIAIKDNGPGIPEAIKDKIFQPFFTTKDTGKGTGLGLSLAYDIVKAHGGEILLSSSSENGSEFLISIPIA